MPRGLVEHRRVVRAAILHEVPLVGDDHDAAAGPVRLAADGRVLIARACGSRRSPATTTSASKIARFAPATLTISTGPAARDLAGPPHPGRVDDAEPPPVPEQRAVDRVARRARHLAHHARAPRAASGSPATTCRRWAARRWRHRSRSEAGGWGPGLGTALSDRRAAAIRRRAFKPPASSLSTISSSSSATPSAVLGGDLEHRVDPEPVELERAVARALVVDLVHGQNDGPARSRAARWRSSRRPPTRPSRPSADEDQQIRAFDRALPLDDDQLVQRILAGAVQTACVEQLKGRLPPRDRLRSSASRVVPGSGATIARRVPVMRLNSVDFPDVGTTDQHDGRRSSLRPVIT